VEQVGCQGADFRSLFDADADDGKTILPAEQPVQLTIFAI
jgi:hypothetical protein